MSTHSQDGSADRLARLAAATTLLLDHPQVRSLYERYTSMETVADEEANFCRAVQEARSETEGATVAVANEGSRTPGPGMSEREAKKLALQGTVAALNDTSLECLSAASELERMRLEDEVEAAKAQYASLSRAVVRYARMAEGPVAPVSRAKDPHFQLGRLTATIAMLKEGRDGAILHALEVGYQRGHEDTVESRYGDPSVVAGDLAPVVTAEAAAGVAGLKKEPSTRMRIAFDLCDVENPRAAEILRLLREDLQQRERMRDGSMVWVPSFDAEISCLRQQLDALAPVLPEPESPKHRDLPTPRGASLETNPRQER
jgi:acylphosphatase